MVQKETRAFGRSNKMVSTGPASTPRRQSDKGTSITKYQARQTLSKINKVRNETRDVKVKHSQKDESKRVEEKWKANIYCTYIRYH